MTGWILGMERPVRMMCEGRLEEMVMAVCAPIPPSEGPVMRTEGVLLAEVHVREGDESGGGAHLFCLERGL
jgi:hypothetical protein